MPVPNPNHETVNSSGQSTEAKSTDFNGDGQRDFGDFLEFASAYGSEQSRFDLDDSGRVDFTDFLRFVQDFGRAGN